LLRFLLVVPLFAALDAHVHDSCSCAASRVKSGAGLALRPAVPRLAIAFTAWFMWCDWVLDPTIARLPNATRAETRQLLVEPDHPPRANEEQVVCWCYRRPFRVAAPQGVHLQTRFRESTDHETHHSFAMLDPVTALLTQIAGEMQCLFCA
jgi:hypothetical protein